MTIHQKIVEREPNESIKTFVDKVTQETTNVITDFVTLGNPPRTVGYPRNDVNIINISYMNENTAIIAYTSN